MAVQNINVKKAYEKRLQALNNVNGENARVHISSNNSKMNDIPSFSVLPLITCTNCGECSKNCYACKGTFNFNNVINSEAENTYLVINNPELVENEINGFLGGITLYRYFRFNVAGDIFSQEYLSIIVNVAIANPGTKFLAFTKNFDLLNGYMNENDLPANLSIVFSRWDNTEIDNPHDMPISVVKVNENTAIPESSFHCNGNCATCLNCWNAKNGDARHFDIH